MRRHTFQKEIITPVREYLLPIASAIGLVIGIFLYFLVNHETASIVWYVFLIVGGIPLIIETIGKLVKGHFSADVVASLAIIVAIILGESFAGIIIVLMQSGGEAIERYGFKRASSSLESLMSRAPKIARRKRGDSVEDIDVGEVKIGDILIVRHGDIIPVNGTVVSGRGYVDESAITGEPVPKKKTKGDKVLSGSINTSGTFEIKTDKLSKESEYAEIVKLVKEAQKRKPNIQRIADKYAVYFTPTTLIIATVGFVITGTFTTFLAVLVVATPCPLIIAVPIAVISGVNRASNKGIVVKSGAAIEQLGRLDKVFLDKTGTITYGTPMLDRIIPIGKIKTNRILYLSASLEQLSSHPLAAALVTEGKKKFHKLEAPKRFKEHPSAGVEGYIGKHHILVGSKKLYESKLKSKFPDRYDATIKELSEKGEMYLFVVVDRKLAGIILLKDKVRRGIKETLRTLHRVGISDIDMLTGDNPINAKVVAGKVGIKTFKASLLPEDKVKIVRKATSSGKNTLMVGDGINDAPSLATATVGMAVGGHGAAVSAEAADVVLMSDDISKVGEAVSIGRRMLTVAKQSIFFGLGASAFLMVVASSGVIPPSVGAVLQEFIDIAVIFNALRVR